VNKIIERIYETDVLVIGGGGAGITAAVAAARSGADVLLISKGKIGNSGNTIMIGGSYAMDGYSAYHTYGLKDADPTLTKDVLFDSIVKDGFHLADQNMVEQFVEESPAIVNEVRLWAERAGQNFRFGPPATWSMSGHAMGKALHQGVKETAGIKTLEDVMIVELLKDGDRTTGALGIDIYTGEIIQLNSKAVILGTGGFQPFTLKNTNSDMTGDGIGMAFRAGAKVADMEFLLFLLTTLEPNEMKGSILPVYLLFLGLEFKVYDGEGNEIIIPHELKEIESKSELGKLIDIYYFGRAIVEGRAGKNGGVYFDFSDTSDEAFNEKFDEIESFFLNFYKKGFYHGDDLKVYRELCIKNKRVEVSMGNEYTVGGILINERMETSIPGLYAAGECASGVFGANRVADAVTEMMVQGYRAGLSAAEYIKQVKYSDNNKNAEETALGLLKYLQNEDGLSAAEVNLQIEKISDKGLTFWRTEEGLIEAINQYETLEKSLDQITLKSKSRAYNFEWIQAIQAKNRLLCSKLAAIMANERKESRGLHLRIDYPEVDNDRYLVRTIAEYKQGKIQLTNRKPIVTKLELPEGGKTEYVKYILENDMGLQNLDYAK